MARHSKWIFVSLLLGLLVWSLWSLATCTTGLSLHEDEFQHTHLAWNTFRGKIIYRDFEDTHGPLSALLGAFFLKIKPGEIEAISTFYYLRYLNLVFVLLTGLILSVNTYLLSQRKLAGALAALIYFSNPSIRALAFRIRPDCYLAFFSVLSLFFWLKKRHFLMGICLGIAVAFHGKFLPINLLVLVAVFIVGLKGENHLKRILLGEAVVFLPILGWLWRHRALGTAWRGFFRAGYLTAQKRLMGTETENYTKLLTTLSKLDLRLGILVLALLIWMGVIFVFVKDRKFKWDSDQIVGGAFSLASLLYLFAPVWGHAVVFLVPTGLAFLTAFLFVSPRWENWMVMGVLMLCGFLATSNLTKYNLARDLEAVQLNSLEVALKETQRQEPIFYIWASRCPAYVFNEDPSRKWMHSFRRRQSDSKPIRMLPPVHYVSFHPMFIQNLDSDERQYLQEHFQAVGCFWKRIK